MDLDEANGDFVPWAWDYSTTDDERRDPEMRG
jgi:hypothetical protein